MCVGGGLGTVLFDSGVEHMAVFQPPGEVFPLLESGVHSESISESEAASGLESLLLQTLG